MGSPRVGDGTRADVRRRIRGRGGGRRSYSRREFCRVRTELFPSFGGRRREEALAGNSGDGRCKIPLGGSDARNGKRSGGAGRSRARVAEMGVMNC